MAQYARPDADDTDGTWTNENDNQTNLYASVDEASADDGTTHIKKADEGMGDDACILRLSDVSTPDSGNAYIKYKAVSTDDSWSGSSVVLKLELLQGSTVKATTTNYDIELDGTTYTDYSYTISDVSGISDWTDLKIRLTMVSGMGMSDTIFVTQVYLETQDAAAEEAATANPAFLLFVD
jgi:hypothetical protein